MTTRFCSHCVKICVSDDVFCADCGNEIEEEETAEPVVFKRLEADKLIKVTMDGRGFVDVPIRARINEYKDVVLKRPYKEVKK